MTTPSTAPSDRALRRRRRRVVLPGLLLAGALALTACSAGGSSSPRAQGRAGGGAASPVATPASLVVPDAPVPFTAPVSLEVSDGTFSSVQVRDAAGHTLAGSLDDAGTTWTSKDRPDPGSTLDVTATVKSTTGTVRTQSEQVPVAEVPSGQRLTLTMQPSDGSVVGVGAPIVIRFDQQVTDRAAVEKAFRVATSAPVVGSWHWLSGREVHFRPEKPWPAHSTVDLSLDLTGVQAGPKLWGTHGYHERFTIGEARVSTVDAKTHEMTVTVDGKKTATWPTSLGKPQFATRSGTYIVLSKTPSLRMTSCSVHIECDKTKPNYYDLTVKWDVRLTWSGTFVHAAPWSARSQGEENVSHGCVNLTEDRAEQFFNASRYGDLVTVKNSSRGPDDLVRRGDPGMADWNSSWASYTAGSALDGAVTTAALGA
ncbi:MAG: Ig-like domain-containing protein [Motilibacteraceae bacterium]